MSTHIRKRRQTCSLTPAVCPPILIPRYLHAFDVAAAQEAGDLMASRHRKGRPGELRDTMIAGIVLAQHAALATRNTAHFDDVPVTLINPWVA